MRKKYILVLWLSHWARSQEYKYKGQKKKQAEAKIYRGLGKETVDSLRNYKGKEIQFGSATSQRNHLPVITR